MTYMTFEEQIASHFEFLKSKGFDVDQIKIDSGFIRCRNHCYKTTQTQLKNGLLGLMTWCRGKNGETKTHKTYGIAQESQVERFWSLSNPIGESDYLQSKGIGYYGIRFRNNSYGRVAVIPMYDISGKLKSYQLLNPDGTKRFLKNTKVKGLLHSLKPLTNGQPYGLAESYATAATCLELTGIPTATVFSTGNLLQTAKVLKNKYPNSPMIIFADNDRHLKQNKGLLAAQAVLKEIKDCALVIPDFPGYPATQRYTDWNDLLREKGYQQARTLISEKIREAEKREDL